MAYDTRSRIHNLLSLIQAATNTEHLWKRHLLMKVDLKRVVFMGSWKGSPRLHSEYWFGLNGGRIWYKEWFGLLAMVLKRPRSARTLNGSIEVCVVGYTLPHNSLSSVITNQPASQAGNQPTRQPASQPTKSSSYIIRHQQDVRDDSCNNCWKHCTVQSVKRWSVTTERESEREWMRPGRLRANDTRQSNTAGLLMDNWLANWMSQLQEANVELHALQLTHINSHREQFYGLWHMQQDT